MTPRLTAALSAIALVGVAMLSRSWQSLGYDELFTLWVSSRPWPDLIDQANIDGFTPPFFYALVKALSLAGLHSEDLRSLPVIFAGLAVFLGLEACHRLFGSGSRLVALLVVPGSAYVFTFAHELRPYSALLACAFLFLGQMEGRSATPRSDARAAGAALLGAAFSYLGLFLVVWWVIQCRRRWPLQRLLMVSLTALTLCAPGLTKAIQLAVAWPDSSIVWLDAWPALSPVLFGLAPVPFGGWIEVLSLSLLAILLAVAWADREQPVLALLVLAFLANTALVLALDAVVRIGFAPRYFALSMAILLLILVGVLSGRGKAGQVVALAFFAVNGVATFRYLTTQPEARENWREAMGRIDSRLGSEGVLLAFPFHHAAVAAHAYAPRIKLGGGYTSGNGPLYWYEPPTAFRGYSFDDLRRVDDAGDVFGRLAATADLCLLSDEPDVTKTETLFAAFRQLKGVAPFAAGDPRLRVLCRSTR